jgi:BirA family biotin operon repressor/biotin-[acetyl-CoA-carboxylase] ligase
MKKTLNKDLWISSFDSKNLMFNYLPNLIVVDSCNSTMDLGRNVLHANKIDKLISSDSKYTACFALEQTRGRGRKDRIWYSKNNGGIYLTLVSKQEFEITKLEGLSLAIGLAIFRTLSKFSINAKLKWPNDVLVNKKKISGILIETFNNSTPGKVNLIVGVGLNYDQNEFESEINATSMLMENNKLVGYEEVSAELCYNIVSIIENFSSFGFSYFKEEWWINSMMIDQMVLNKEMDLSGKCVGLTDNGMLLIEIEGEPKEIFVGDVELI